MSKYLALAILMLAALYPASAQHKQIDSLNKRLPLLHDTARVNCLNEAGRYYCNWFNAAIPNSIKTDSAEFYTNQAYTDAIRLKFKFGLANAFVNFGNISFTRLRCYEAQKHFEAAISLFKELNDVGRLNLAYLYLGKVLNFEGEIPSAEKNIRAALAYYKTTSDTANIARAERYLGDCYAWQGYNEKAFEQFQNSLALTRKLDDPVSILVSLDRRIQLFDAAGWTDSSKFYSNVELAYERKIGYKKGIVDKEADKFWYEHKWDSVEYCYQQEHYIISKELSGRDSLLLERELLRNDLNLASAYQFHGKYAEALPYFTHALQWDKNANNVIEMHEVLLNISQIYHLWEKDQKAVYYLQELLSLAQRTGARPYLRDAYQLLWEIHDKRKDSAIAYNYYFKYSVLKDSLTNDAYQRKLAVIEELIKANEQQAQIASLDKDNKLKEAAIQKNVLQRNILFASVFLLTLLAVIVYRVINLKRKNERLKTASMQHSFELERIENEKKQSELQSKASELEMQALRSQMNPHFIFNCLSSINRFILKNKTEEASDYLTKFSRLIRMVLNNSKRAYISLEDELETLRLYLEMERLRFKNSFDYSFTYNNSVDIDNIFIPPLLLQPFAENAIWHGLMHRQEKGFLNFDFTAEEKFLLCIITDNGVGREQAELLKSKSAEKQKSMGLKITSQRLSLLNNNSNEQTFFTIEDLTDENENATGTRVHLKIYYKEMMEV